ncbi:hypothetical protein [Arthrobacter sp. UYCu712]|uniref:hypothetical protein n=1 Tax=Arthrobacter sp. UYCu712 TaxID=3156340 RepID=UPI003392D048
MASFALDGMTYEYFRQDSYYGPGAIGDWTYGEYPKVMASVPLAGGRTVGVYARASRWNPTQILVSWQDDDMRPHSAWVPAANVHKLNDSEWDIEEHRRCPEILRHIRWAKRLPGFPPETDVAD